MDYYLYIHRQNGNIQFKPFIKAEDLPGYPKKENPNQALEFEDFEEIYSYKDKGYVNFYLTTSKLIKINRDMTELLATYSLTNNNMWQAPTYLRRHILFGINELWVVLAGNQNSLLHFNVESEEWTIYDYPKIPITWINGANGYNYDIENDSIYELCESFLDWGGEGIFNSAPKPIVPVSSCYKKDNNYYADNALLYFNRDENKWDTIRIDLTNNSQNGILFLVI